MGRIKLDTLSDFERHGYFARIICGGCGRKVDANPLLMRMEMVKGGSRLVEAIERRMRCTRCGHRGAKIEPCERHF